VTKSTQPGGIAGRASTIDPAQMTVALLCGGTSGEREISLSSARMVHGVLEAEGFKVLQIDTAEPSFLRQIEQARPDVAFIALHGKGGEDGTIQGALELMGIPYTGSGVLASALAMDKWRCKFVYEAAGLNVPVSMWLPRGREIDLEEMMSYVGMPCVIKPVADGSSLGISIVRKDSELLHALDLAFALSDVCMAERFVEGVEVTVPVLGNLKAEALPVVEIVPKNDFYDYESKYTEGGSQHIIPARISEEATRACKDAALAAHLVLGCSGMSRTDLIVDADDQPWVIETNTIPGMTATSLVPDAARAYGIEPGALYRLLIELALE
jgi:D-alanine-D-alanine ligase